MPNYCENDLVITGPKADIAAFLDAAHQTDEDGDEMPISLKRLVPVPDDWRKRNWGTKWDLFDFSNPKTSQGGRRYRVSFLTAWLPPATAIEIIAEQFPTLKFSLRYYEAGNGFKGCLVVKGVEVLEQWDGDYRGSRGG